MEDETHLYEATLAILLYFLHYQRYKNMEEWTDVQKNYFINTYGLEKTKIMGECIKRYFENKDINLLKIHPDMNATSEEREAFLRYLLNGFIQSGFVD